MDGSVTEARSHDDGTSGGSVTGMHRSATGKRAKCNWEHGNGMNSHKSTTGTWVHVLLKCTLGWAWEGNYKINDQLVCEWVTASIYYNNTCILHVCLCVCVCNF